MNTITVYIADVSEILRSGIKHLLTRSEHIGTIQTFSNAESLISSFHESPYAVCILSSNLSDMNLKDIMNRLKEINPDVKSLVITGTATITNVNLALDMGVKGYVTRQVSAQELESVVLSVWKNKQAFSRNVSDTIVGHYANSHKPGIQPDKQTITNREKEILAFIVKGLTSAEIAKHLYISPRTVETHRANLMQKLNIKNTAGLVRYALNEGEHL